MLYRDISLVSIFGLRGSLYVQRAGDAQGVSLQTEGPYEAKVVDGTCLMIYPEGEEPQFPQQFISHTDIIIGQTHVGSVDVAATARFLTDSRPRRKAPASARAEAAIHITAPPKNKFELMGCHGMRKGPHGQHLMRGKDRFSTR
jgi:hypothetical protein